MRRRGDAAERDEREREMERRAVADGRRNVKPQGEKLFDAFVSVVGFGALIWWLFF